jgi:hypothetical protein
MKILAKTILPILIASCINSTAFGMAANTAKAKEVFEEVRKQLDQEKYEEKRKFQLFGEAVRSGNTNLVRRLLEALTNEEKFTFITYYNEDGCFQNLLASTQYPDLFKLFLDVLTPELKIIAIMGIQLPYIHNLQSIQTLFANLSKKQQLDLVTNRDRDGNTALHKAISPEEATLLMAIVPEDQRTELILSVNNDGLSTLHSAKYRGQEEVIKKLLEFLKEPEKAEMIKAMDYLTKKINSIGRNAAYERGFFRKRNTWGCIIV